MKPHYLLQYNPKIYNYFTTLSKALLQKLGWKPGDTIQQEIRDDTLVLKKVQVIVREDPCPKQ